MCIKVAIVEDNQDIRTALEQIINMTEELELCCTCENGEDALIKLRMFKPQIVLMDIHLGGIDGIEVVKILKSEEAEMLFMMCTVYEEDEKIFEALRAGASGYIIKKTTPSKLLEAIKELSEGGAPMSSQIARKVVSAFQYKPIAVTDDPLAILSKRELEVLQMLANGLVYKEIADKLFVTCDTVKKHVYNVYEKLHVKNKLAAVNIYFGRQMKK
jgi:DNA-binding NarL/FixJ family response regulator